MLLTTSGSPPHIHLIIALTAKPRVHSPCSIGRENLDKIKSCDKVRGRGQKSVQRPKRDPYYYKLKEGIMSYFWKIAGVSAQQDVQTKNTYITWEL